jgi:hypothetical protein
MRQSCPLRDADVGYCGAAVSFCAKLDAANIGALLMNFSSQPEYPASRWFLRIDAGL